MADVARLSLEVSVNGAQRARQALQGLQDGSIRATRATDQLVAANTRLNATTSRSAGVFRLQKGAIQQAGFQIGDFATQVAGGQSALVAFAQQGSQLAGILGPGGAVLGAVIAIGGAIAGGLVRAFSEGSEEAKTLAERIRDVAESTDELTAAQVRALKADFFAGNRDRLQKITAERQRIKELNEEIAENERLMQQQAGQRDTGMTSGILGTTVQGLRDQAASTSQLAERNRELRKELDETQASIDTYFQSADQLNKEIQELIFGEDDHAKTLERVKEEVNDLNASLQFQIDTYGESERAIQLAKIQQLAKNGADAEAVRQARELTNALYDKIEAEEMESRMQRDLAQLDPAQAEFNRYADQIDRIEEYNISAAEKERLREEAFWQHQQKMQQIAKQGAETVNIEQTYWQQYLESLELGLRDFEELSSSVINNFSSSFGNALESVVFDFVSVEDAGKQMLETILRGTINALGQMAAQWLAYQAVQAAFGAATIASTTAQASTAAAAWAPAAALASLATGGANAAPAALALTSTTALSQGLAMAGGVPSFDGGGYTGDGSRTRGLDGKGGFLAMLHPQEQVIDKTKGQSMGGVTVNVMNAPAGTRTEERTDANGNVTIDVLVADLANGGRASKAMATTFGLKRVGR